jgi:hypothetical protein
MSNVVRRNPISFVLATAKRGLHEPQLHRAAERLARTLEAIKVNALDEAFHREVVEGIGNH